MFNNPVIKSSMFLWLSQPGPCPSFLSLVDTQCYTSFRGYNMVLQHLSNLCHAHPKCSRQCYYSAMDYILCCTFYPRDFFIPSLEACTDSTPIHPPCRSLHPAVNLFLDHWLLTHTIMQLLFAQ